MISTLLVALTGLGGVDAPTVVPDSLTGPGAAVPYVGQEPLLCGGAAIAMVARYWGATGVYATDFHDLVRPERGGILTTDLDEALALRGYPTRVVRNAPEVVFEALASDVPPILLLGDAGTLLHYVVLVRAGPRHVWIHDPARGPSRRMTRTELHRRWAETGFWALLSAPQALDESADARAADPHPDANATVSRAVEALEQRRFGDARALARAVIDRGGDTETGRRIVATSYYLEGETDRALSEWNEVGEPVVDLIHVEGGTSTMHSAWMRRIGLEEGRVLSPAALARARRRLRDEPTVRASRIEYRPQEDGSVEVRAYVLENGRTPSRARYGVEAVRAALSEQLSLEVGPVLGVGDRWLVRAHWSRSRTHVEGGVRASLSGVPGIVSLGLDRTTERYPDLGGTGEHTTAQRVSGSLRVHEWLSGEVRVGGSVGVERWADGRRFATAGVDGLWSGGPLESAFEGSWATGAGADYGRARFRLRAQHAVDGRGTLRWSTAATTTTDAAPRMMWPGAGTGRVRADLMRGYPLDVDGAIAGPMFGRTLVVTGLDYRVARRVGPVTGGVGLFAEAGQARRRVDGLTETLADVGVELFSTFAATEFGVSLAWGRAGGVLSAAVRERW